MKLYELTDKEREKFINQYHKALLTSFQEDGKRKIKKCLFENCDLDLDNEGNTITLNFPVTFSCGFLKMLVRG